MDYRFCYSFDPNEYFFIEFGYHDGCNISNQLKILLKLNSLFNLLLHQPLLTNFIWRLKINMFELFQISK